MSPPPPHEGTRCSRGSEPADSSIQWWAVLTRIAAQNHTEERHLRCQPEEIAQWSIRSDFTEDDEGKPVVDINGGRVGTVIAVRDGVAYVKFKTDLITTLEATFGFEMTDRGLYPLYDEMVDTVLEEKVRVKGDHVPQ